MILIYLIYYTISIFAIWVGIYFRRFTVSDYQYNQSLIKKRRFAIIFLYLMMALQGYIIGARKIIIYSFNNSPWIVGSAIFFGILYTIVLGKVEIPNLYPKKKRWK